MKLSKGQRTAVKKATTSPVLITGSPGCGKTSTAAAVVKLWRAMKKDMKLAAPTGILCTIHSARFYIS
jgi:broad-specificity NMP kinase